MEELLLHELLHDYLDMEMLQYYRASFIDTAVQAVAQMASIATDGAMDVEEYIVQGILQEVLEERFVPPRAVPHFLGKTTRVDAATIEQALVALESRADTCEQKTQQWYEMRHNMLTATAVSSLLGSQSKRNEVIYEKCRPYVQQRPLSIYDARHWGVKYEPVTRSIYERMFRTKVREYGCIPHATIPYLGASPDGINVDPRCGAKYGRLLEIKNVVSREITGDPLDDYWVQMQVQMEVCNLDVCDFVETKIEEFPTMEAFFAYRDQYDFCGVALHFVGLTDRMENHYVYSPLLSGHHWAWSDIEWWMRQMQRKHRHQYSLQGPLFWYLADFSCVVVPRNAVWMEAALPRIGEVWSLIEEERVSGAFTHRAPKPRLDRSLFLGPVATVVPTVVATVATVVKHDWVVHKVLDEASVLDGTSEENICTSSW